MSKLFTLPKEVVLTNAGDPIPGAKAYFYAANTATPQSVYTEYTLTTPHSDPVVADGDGRFPTIYLDPTLDYKVVIKDADDVEVYTQDYVATPASSTSVGESLYPITAAETAAGVTPTDFSYPTLNALRYGTNTTPGTTDMLAAIQAAVDVGGDDSTILIPDGDYLLSGPIQVTTDNTHIILSSGATLTATDTGATVFTTLEIDDTKAGMPQMKALVAFLECTDSSISGGGTINALGLEWDTGPTENAGHSGVFVRGCTGVIVENLNIKNVWPSALLLPGRDVTVVGDGGVGDSRFSGICFVQCTGGIIRHNRVDHCKYDGIAARMQNTDIQVYDNRVSDCHEGIQNSDRYGTVAPPEDNFRQVIKDNEIFGCYTSAVTIHGGYTTVSGNHIHSPVGDTTKATAAIAAIGSEQCDVINNTIEGYDDTSDNMATFNYRGVRMGVGSQSRVSGNTIRWCNEGIIYSDTVTSTPVITGNSIVECNTGIDLRVTGDTTTRDRRANISGNLLLVYRYGVRAQDTGPCRIIDNTIGEQSGWVGTSIGLDLDPAGNGDTEYYISGSMPEGFSTNISLPKPTNPVTASYTSYIGADMYNGGDRYFNRGLLEIATGLSSGTDLLSTNLTPTIAPGPGEVQVTQMSGTPVPFRWSVNGTGTTLTITLAAAAPDDLSFGWTVHLMGYVV